MPAAHAAGGLQGLDQLGRRREPAQRRDTVQTGRDEGPAPLRPRPARMPVGVEHGHGQATRRWVGQRPRVDQPDVLPRDRSRVGRTVAAFERVRETRRLRHSRVRAGLRRQRRAAAGQGVEHGVGLVDGGTDAVPVWRRVFGHIVGVEQIGLGARRACHPLPGEMVAAQIAVEQVRDHPVGTRAPVHFANVHEVGRQPHPRVVVQIAGRVERARRLVDDRHAGGTGPHVFGHGGAIRGIGQGAGVQRFQNALAVVPPGMAEEGAPAQLMHQLVGQRQAMRGAQRVDHLGQRQQSVRQVWRQPGDRAVQMVAAARIVSGAHRGKPRAGRLDRGREVTRDSGHCGRRHALDCRAVRLPLERLQPDHARSTSGSDSPLSALS